jgi:hypothetical protein
MGEMLQHVLVTMVAAGAVAVIVRRVAGTFGPSNGVAPPKCANCPSAEAHGMTAARQPSGDAIIRIDDLLNRKPNIQVH